MVGTGEERESTRRRRNRTHPTHKATDGKESQQRVSANVLSVVEGKRSSS